MACLAIVQFIGCIQHSDVRIYNGLHLVFRVRAVDAAHILQCVGQALGIVGVYGDVAIFVGLQVRDIAIPGVLGAGRGTRRRHKSWHVLTDMESNFDIGQTTRGA